MKKLLSLALFVIVSFSAGAQTFNSFTVTVTGKGRPVIFIPGYSCSGDVWKETVEHLQASYECHVLSIAGYAGVPAIDTPILATVKNQVIAYVKTHELQKPILVGHSLGAFMSLWVSAEAPELFGKVICVDGVPFLSAMNDTTANADSLKKDPRFNPTTIVKSFESIPDSGYVENTMRAMLWQVADTARARQIATWSYLSNRRTLGLSLYEISTTDLRQIVSKISQPVLVLGSLYGTAENSEKILAAQYKNVANKTIRVAKSKHFIMYDAPLWMYSEIDNFLK
jgi:pimeloyl-ACP methyl ester carboxylesterase